MLDALLSRDASSGEGAADSPDHRFGLQRLHEDLGRRLSVTLDGWSGTRVGTGTDPSWKPLRGQVMYLAVEHQQALAGRGGRDVMARASASFLNGGPRSDDWHPSGRGWVAVNLYVDAAHFVNGDRSAFAADYRTSYYLKIAAADGGEQLKAVPSDNAMVGLGLRRGRAHRARQ